MRFNLSRLLHPKSREQVLTVNSASASGRTAQHHDLVSRHQQAIRERRRRRRGGHARIKNGILLVSVLLVIRRTTPPPRTPPMFCNASFPPRLWTSAVAFARPLAHTRKSTCEPIWNGSKRTVYRINRNKSAANQTKRRRTTRRIGNARFAPHTRFTIAKPGKTGKKIQKETT